MPARTNEFQTLIHLIEAQLAGNGTTVTESKMIRDETIGDTREVDVHLSTKTGDTVSSVGIECVAQRRRTDVTWVEGRIQKHRDLRTTRLILVSKSGFTAAAAAKASHHGVETLTLEPSSMDSWSNLPGPDYGFVLQNARLSTVHVTVPSESRFQVRLAPGTPPLDQSALTYPLQDNSGTTVGTLISVMNSALSSGIDISPAQQSELGSGTDVPVSIDMEFPPGYALRDKDGSYYPILACHWNGVVQFTRTLVPLDNSMYRGACVLSGGTQVDQVPVQVAAVQSRSPTFSVALSLGPGRPPLRLEMRADIAPPPPAAGSAPSASES